MEIGKYQIEAQTTAIYTRPIDFEWLYPLVNLSAEVGELSGKLGRVIRGDCVVDDNLRRELMFELGDVLWQLSQLATELDLDMDVIAEANLTKLQLRKEKGVIKGSGDDR